MPGRVAECLLIDQSRRPSFRTMASARSSARVSLGEHVVDLALGDDERRADRDRVPRLRMITPSSCAKDAGLGADAFLGSNQRLGRLSATSSRPATRPMPRTSPTSG